MSLEIGMRLGPYEIVATLGAGGMGEVYRAKDTRLNRIVAIKVLSSRLSNHADLKQRFEREARAISGLSHSNVCALYDIGHQDDIDYLVMEFLDGETLSQRLTKGALSTEQVLRHGIEIASALHKAHKEGIVHRDLKPGNIMMTRSGAKLLDFGLAKFEDPTILSSNEGASALATEAKSLTAEGMVLGTVQYMSPEQLEGKRVDERTDIFALGSVLHEMATGRRAFSGKSQASLISSILKDDPPRASQVQPTSPAALDHVIKKCLAKDPEERWQSAYDVESELRWIAETSLQELPAQIGARSKKQGRFWMAISVLLLLTTIGFAFLFIRKPQSEGPQLIRFTIQPPRESTFRGAIALSPDGKKLAFVATDANGVTSLWVRALDSTEAQRFPETDDASFPFWSPDGRFIAYFSRGKLRKIDSGGGTPQVMCDASDGRGGSWGANGTILFSRNTNEGLFRVPADGGTVESQIANTGGSLRWPIFLPDGKHFLYVYQTGTAEMVGLYASSLDSKESKKLLDVPTTVVYVSPGYLLYTDQGSLMSRPFDANHLQFRGDPVPVASQPWVDYYIFGSAGLSASESGVLAYRQGGNQLGQFTWFDRRGKKLDTVGPPSGGSEPACSPDGNRIVFYQSQNVIGLDDEWLLDLISGKLTRFTFDPADDNTSAWSSDGSRIVWSSVRNGTYNFYQKLASGAGNDELLFADNFTKYPDDFSPDGKFLLYDSITPKSADLMVLPLTGDRKPFPYMQTSANEVHGRFSPDGKWIAYTSDESGKSEIYVQAFPATKSGKWQVSNSGGDQPEWRRDGKELFYVAPDASLMSVDVHLTESDFSSGTPIALFKSPLQIYGITSSRNDYLVTADGERFLINIPLEDTSKLPITVILNWTKLLKQ